MRPVSVANSSMEAAVAATRIGAGDREVVIEVDTGIEDISMNARLLV